MAKSLADMIAEEQAATPTTKPARVSLADMIAEEKKRESSSSKPGQIMAEWYEEPPETGDKPRMIGELPPQNLGRIETSPSTGKKVYTEDTGKTRAVFTDQPQAGQGGRVSATALSTAEEDKDRLAKQALAGGALQGATLGFADELAGVASAATGGTYRGGRNEARTAFKESDRGDPSAFGKGQLLGSAATMAVPGVGTAGMGARAARVAQLLKEGKSAEEALRLARPAMLSPRGVAVGGAIGAVAASGSSEADLLKGEYGQFAADVGKGAAAGSGATAAIGLAGKGLKKAGEWMHTAPERAATRADDQLWETIAYGATKDTREKLAGPLGSERSAVLDMVRSNPQFMEAVRVGDKSKAADIVLSAIPEVEARKAATIAGMESKTGKRLAGKPIVESLEARVAELRATPTPENVAVADNLQRRADAIKETWMPPPKEPRLEGESLASRLTSNADAGSRERASISSSEFGKIAEKYGLGKDTGNIPARQEKIQSVLDTLNGKTAAIYDKAANKGEGIYVANVTGKLREWAEELRKAPMASGQRDAAAIDALAESISNSEKANGRLTYTPKELRAEITRIQDKAFAGSYSDPSEAREMGRELASRLRGILDEHVEKYGSKADLKRLQTLNRQISALIVFKESADREAVKAFEDLRKLPVVSPEAQAARTGRAKVSELYNLIQSTDDPEAKRILTGELYRQIGPDAAKKLTAIEREHGLLGWLGDVTTQAAQHASGDTLRGKRLGKIAYDASRVMYWLSKNQDKLGDKANAVAITVENVLRRGGSNAQLRAIGKLYGFSKEMTEDMIHAATPVEAGSSVAIEKVE